MTSQRAEGSRPSGRSHRPLPVIHFAAALLAVVDFTLFHLVAVGLVIAIYFGVPLLDDAISRDATNWNWLGIFKIVGPTVTVPGGAVTVLSTYFYSRRTQEAERREQEAEQQRQETEQQLQEEARLRREAEAQVQTLKAQLEQATAAPRRRNRRRLRNGPSRRER